MHERQLYVNESDTLRAGVYRANDGLVYACQAVLAYYYGFSYDDCDWEVFKAASLCELLGMDVAKAVAGIDAREPTTFSERPDVGNDEKQRRRVAVYTLFLQLSRYFLYADDMPSIIYGRFARAGLSYPRLVDRYLERQQMSRLSLNGALTEHVNRILAT